MNILVMQTRLQNQEIDGLVFDEAVKTLVHFFD